ncbi:hypothetical protein [Mycoplasmopsis adleri]|uniref:hypothetical protein n=1 Tax=Mycoplasmopsis adleri TaxID=51362 RepID=UPI0038739BD7
MLKTYEAKVKELQQLKTKYDPNSTDIIVKQVDCTNVLKDINTALNNLTPLLTVAANKADIEAKIAYADGAIQKVNDDINKLLKEYQETVKKLQDLIAEAKNFKDTMKDNSLSAAKDALQTAIEKATQAITTNTREAITTATNELTQTYNNAKKLFKECDDNKARLLQQIANLLKQGNEKVQPFTNDVNYETYVQQMNQLKTKYSVYNKNSELKALQDAHDALKGEIAQLIQNIDNTTQQLNAANSAYNSVIQALIAKQTELSNNNTLKQYDAIIADITTHLADFNNEKDSAKTIQQINDLTSKVTAYTATIDGWQAAATSLSDKIQEVSQYISKNNYPSLSSYSQLQQAIEEAKKSLESGTEASDKDNENKLKQIYEQYQQEVAQLNNDKTQALQRNKSLINQINELKNEMEKPSAVADYTNALGKISAADQSKLLTPLTEQNTLDSILEANRKLDELLQTVTADKKAAEDAYAQANKELDELIKEANTKLQSAENITDLQSSPSYTELKNAVASAKLALNKKISDINAERPKLEKAIKDFEKAESAYDQKRTQVISALDDAIRNAKECYEKVSKITPLKNDPQVTAYQQAIKDAENDRKLIDTTFPTIPNARIEQLAKALNDQTKSIESLIEQTLKSQIESLDKKIQDATEIKNKMADPVLKKYADELSNAISQAQTSKNSNDINTIYQANQDLESAISTAKGVLEKFDVYKQLLDYKAKIEAGQALIKPGDAKASKIASDALEAINKVNFDTQSKEEIQQAVENAKKALADIVKARAEFISTSVQKLIKNTEGVDNIIDNIKVSSIAETLKPQLEGLNNKISALNPSTDIDKWVKDINNSINALEKSYNEEFVKYETVMRSLKDTFDGLVGELGKLIVSDDFENIKDNETTLYNTLIASYNEYSPVKAYSIEKTISDKTPKYFIDANANLNNLMSPENLKVINTVSQFVKWVQELKLPTSFLTIKNTLEEHGTDFEDFINAGNNICQLLKNSNIDINNVSLNELQTAYNNGLNDAKAFVDAFNEYLNARSKLSKYIDAKPISDYSNVQSWLKKLFNAEPDYSAQGVKTTTKDLVEAKAKLETLNGLTTDTNGLDTLNQLFADKKEAEAIFKQKPEEINGYQNADPIFGKLINWYTNLLSDDNTIIQDFSNENYPNNKAKYNGLRKDSNDLLARLKDTIELNKIEAKALNYIQNIGPNNPYFQNFSSNLKVGYQAALEQLCFKVQKATDFINLDYLNPDTVHNEQAAKGHKYFIQFLKQICNYGLELTFEDPFEGSNESNNKQYMKNLIANKNKYNEVLKTAKSKNEVLEDLMNNYFGFQDTKDFNQDGTDIYKFFKALNSNWNAFPRTQAQRKCWFDIIQDTRFNWGAQNGLQKWMFRLKYTSTNQPFDRFVLNKDGAFDSVSSLNALENNGELYYFDGQTSIYTQYITLWVGKNTSNKASEVGVLRLFLLGINLYNALLDPSNPNFLNGFDFENYDTYPGYTGNHHNVFMLYKLYITLAK